MRRSLFSGGDFTLERVSFVNNGFKPLAKVAFSDALSGGTLVKVTLASSIFARVFLTFWFGLVTFWTVFASISVAQKGTSAWFPVLFGPGFMGFGLALSAFGRLIAYNDAPYLVKFLKEELQLQEPPAWSMPVA